MNEETGMRAEALRIVCGDKATIIRRSHVVGAVMASVAMLVMSYGIYNVHYGNGTFGKAVALDMPDDVAAKLTILCAGLKPLHGYEMADGRYLEGKHGVFGGNELIVPNCVIKRYPFNGK